MARYDDTFKMDPISLCAVIGGAVAFVAVGAIVDVIWVAIGVAIGAAAGYGIRRLGRNASTYRDAVELQGDLTKDQLYEQAQRLHIDGRSTMDRDQLAAAVAERRAAS